MSKLNISRLTNENEDGSPYISGISTFSSTAFLVPPSGTTAQRPEFVKPGMIRFNTDGAHLEYYNGVEWTEVVVANNDLNGGNRGLFGGGFIYTAPATYANSNVIDYITISTLSNAIDFGDLQSATRGLGGCSSSTRGLFGGGGEPGINVIDFITISSTGNGSDFGDLTQARAYVSSLSSQTRGIWSSGQSGPNTSSTSNTIDFVTIASIGNAVDFGDIQNIVGGSGACSSSTRGIIAGGEGPGDVKNNVINFITISTTGNSADFGDMSRTIAYYGACSNSTRGLFAGGSPSATNAIDYITIATTGNSQDFGDLTASKNSNAGCSSPTRGIFAGGQAPTGINVIEYVTILTTGDAIDFGDLTTTNRFYVGALSNGHGGL